MHAPWMSQLEVIWRFLRYIKGPQTSHQGKGILHSCRGHVNIICHSDGD